MNFPFISVMFVTSELIEQLCGRVLLWFFALLLLTSICSFSVKPLGGFTHLIRFAVKCSAARILLTVCGYLLFACSVRVFSRAALLLFVALAKTYGITVLRAGVGVSL
ncbi:MAG: hypothetical protein ACI4K7_02575, partial [Oscillospiraceae bacterium]